MHPWPQSGAVAGRILLALSAAACGATSGTGRATGDVPVETGPPSALPTTGGLFRPGETMRFELSLRGIVGGEAALAVGDPGTFRGKRVIIVRSRVESAGIVAMFRQIRDEVATWVDLDSGLPLELSAQVRFGNKESLIEARFDGVQGGGFDLEVRRPGSQARHLFRQTMPSDLATFDAHSAIGALRAWKADEGQVAYFYVLVGRYLWQNTIRMTRRERVRTRLGRFEAVVIEGVARRLTRTLREDPKRPTRYYTLWLSDDAQRLPLLVEGKTEYGDVKAELIQYDAPASEPRAAK